MKRIIILALALCLSACGSNTTTEVTGGYALPKGLQDCAFYRLQSATELNVTVARCPNSVTTTVQQDKAQTTSVVVDGVPYSPEGK